MRFSAAAARFVDDAGILGRIPPISRANGWQEQNLTHVDCGGTGMTNKDSPYVVACGTCQIQTTNLDNFIPSIQEC